MQANERGTALFSSMILVSYKSYEWMQIGCGMQSNTEIKNEEGIKDVTDILLTLKPRFIKINRQVNHNLVACY